MWSRNKTAAVGRMMRSAIALAVAGLLGGCFQPLYGDHAMGSQTPLRGALASVDVQQIAAPRGSSDARIAVVLRNALLFDLTGGGESIAPSHRLKINMTISRSALIVDNATGRTVAEVTGIDTSYTLTDLSNGKVVVNGTSFSRVSSDVPGLQQRFAMDRGLRDAEDRAAKVVAEQITSRISSYLVAGT